MKKAIPIVITLVVLYLVGYVGIWQWGICRIYVPPGYSLRLYYKGNILWGENIQAGKQFAQVDENGIQQVGVLEEMPGPGRYFEFDPIHYQRELVPDVIIKPGQVGIVTSQVGESLEAGKILVDDELDNVQTKGTLRRTLRPGRYRINNFGFKVEIQDAPKKPLTEGSQQNWIQIEPGYVGVVTNQTDIPDLNQTVGLQQDVLQPGIYVINGRERRVDIVEIGYREISIKADLQSGPNGDLVLDENGEPQLASGRGAKKGISFPSKDGYDIFLDFTAIWGITPEQAPAVTQLFESVSEVEKRVILPEIGNICRIYGSKLGAVELLTGDSREQFQKDISTEFHKTLGEKNISLLVGLVRHIHIPAKIRGPRQKANIATELKMTLDEETITAQVEAELEEAKSMVDRDKQEVVAETQKMYEEYMATGRKGVREVEAETEKLVAAIARKTADVEAQSRLVLGAADAQVEQMKNEADAQKFQLAVEAFGSPQAYNQWVFSSNLPPDLKLIFLHAGEGTFWTDLKGFQEMAAGQILKNTQETGQPKRMGPRN